MKSKQNIEHNIQDDIEAICTQGCVFVNQAIAKMEQGLVFDEISCLNRTERQQVLRELKAIMRVYKQT